MKPSITFETSNTHCGVLKLADKPSGLGGGDFGKKPDRSGLTAPWRFESFPYSHTCKLSKKPGIFRAFYFIDTQVILIFVGGGG
jgi:hypothetical protein